MQNRNAASLPNLVDARATKPRRKKAVFVDLPLTLDEDTAKYMPYSRVSFPKLHTSKGGTGFSAKAEMDNLWLVGMLDHQRQIAKQDGLRDIAHFLKLPDGNILPGAVEELWKVYRNKERPSSAEQRRRGIMVREGKPLTQGEIRRVMGKAVMAAKLSDADLIRLREIEAGPQKRWSKKDLQRTLRGTVYRKENKKLRRAIRERRPKLRETRIRSKAMEILFEIERRQVVATIKIQRAWKRYLRLKFWKEYLLKVAAATKIQTIVRGTVVREFVRRWYRRKVFLATLAQACVRGTIKRKQVRIKHKLETLASTVMQRIVRGYLSRLRVTRVQLEIAAESIQRVWRGVVGRARADRMWLNKQVIMIQRVVRGHLERTRSEERRLIIVSSARNIQRVYRGYQARQERSELLWERETYSRQTIITRLRIEDQYYAELCAEAERDMSEADYGVRLQRLRQDLDRARDTVYGMEYDYLGFVDERKAVSPRAIRQGFTDALDENVKDWRSRLTTAKIDCVLDTEKALRDLEQEQGDKQEELDALHYRFKRVQKERHWALTSLWRRNSERKWLEESHSKRLRVASQKRKWRIKFFTRNGKPDKKRRDGHPWSEDAFAGPEHETFFLGGANLLVGRKGESPGRLGSEKALATAIDAVHLQSTMNQMIQYGALLKPLFSTMEEAQADLVVNEGFPRVSHVDLPAPEPGAAGPVLAPHLDAERQLEADLGSPMREAVGSPGYRATTELALVPVGETKETAAPAGERQTGAQPKKKPKKGVKGARKPYASRIPWMLLDELEAEKHKLVTEQVNRLPFERQARAGMDMPFNPLTLDPKDAKNQAKKSPVHPRWPNERGGSRGLRIDER